MTESSPGPKVLVLVQYYLPGFKSGGPVRSIDGLIAQLGREFDFRVVAYDRDSGDSGRYAGIQCGQWNRVGDQQVWYVPKDRSRWRQIRSLLAREEYDLIYLQSLFNPCFSLWPLLLRALGVVSRTKRVLLAPRGELSKGALGIKSFKKRFCLLLLRGLGMCRNVRWQATSDEEQSEIVSSGLVTGPAASVFRASNLKRIDDQGTAVSTEGQSDRVRVVFLSRIAPKKNLDYAIRALMKVKSQVDFSIYGPIDRDESYWDSCRSLLDELPSNVVATYFGAIDPDKVHEMYSSHDVLLLPTRGENFGHVIVEALLAGCSAMISDQTPWRSLAGMEAGWDFALDEVDRFANAIDEYAKSDAGERLRRRRSARAAGEQFLDVKGTAQSNRKMILGSLAVGDGPAAAR